MNNSKTSYTLFSSSSYNNTQKLLSSGADLNFTEKLYLARRKLLPVIDNVMKTATENRRHKNLNEPYYLTVEQYEDAVWASQLLKQVDTVYSSSKNAKHLKKHYNKNQLNLERENIKISDNGKIVVNTSILIQLIELHNTLGDVIFNTQETPIEGNAVTNVTNNNASFYASTENCTFNNKHDLLAKRTKLSNEKLNSVSINVNRDNTVNEFRCKLNSVDGSNKEPLVPKNQSGENYIKTNLTDGFSKIVTPLGREYIIMSSYGSDKTQSQQTYSDEIDSTSGSKKNLSTLPEERTSNSEVKLSASKEFTRKTQSTGSMHTDSNRSKVTDVAGARDIIVKCIADLNKIRSFFEMESVDVGVTAEIQIQRSRTSGKSGTIKSEPFLAEQKHSEFDFKHCCCVESGPIEVPVEDLLGKDGTASKLIICIKGKSEEDDVQIIIRRCSDCQDVDTQPSTAVENESRDRRVTSSQQVSDQHIFNDVSEYEHRSVSFSPNDGQPNGINVIFDPEDPSKSVVKSSYIPCPYLRDSVRCKAECECSGNVDKATGSSEITRESVDRATGSFNRGAESIDRATESRDGDTESVGETIESTPRIPESINDIHKASETSRRATEVPYRASEVSHEASETSRRATEVPYRASEVSHKASETSRRATEVPYRPSEVSHKASENRYRASETPHRISEAPSKPSEASRRVSQAPHRASEAPYRASEVSHRDTEATIRASQRTQEDEFQEIRAPPSILKFKSDSNKYIDKDLDKLTDNLSRTESYSKIKLYETTNLCFSTEDGQELIISLTIKPRTSKPPKTLSIKDIFSESGQDIHKSKSGDPGRQTLDRVIPLARTKVCSSLEFDVAVMDTNMRNNGIQHINPNIVVRLKELGVNNLLRACRPVKCGRPSVLNETLCKSIPYSASLISLPLEDADVDIINQSLNMSINRIKHSKMMVKERMNKQVCFARCTHNINCNKKSKIFCSKILNSDETTKLKRNSEYQVPDKKLNFYINLVHDIENTHKECTYEVRFFEYKRYYKEDSPENSTTTVNDTTYYKSENSKFRASLATKELITKGSEKVKLIPSTSKGYDRHKLKRNIDLTSPQSTCEKISAVSKLPLYKVGHSVTNSSPEKCKRNLESILRLRPREEKRKSIVSKIPVYKFNMKSISRPKNDLECDSDIYDISLESLPREDACNLLEERPMESMIRGNDFTEDAKVICKPKFKNVGRLEECFRVSSSSAETIYTLPNENNLIDKSKSPQNRSQKSPVSSELYFNKSFQQNILSARSLCKKRSSAKILRKRKKKSQFRLSSTRSRILFNDSEFQIRQEDLTRYDNVNSHTLESEDLGEYTKDDFKSILKAFTSEFCDYLVRNSLSESKHSILRTVRSTSSLSSYKENVCDNIKQFVSTVKQKIVEEIKSPTPRFLSQPNVEAGMEQEDVSVRIEISKMKFRNYNRNIAGSVNMNYFESKMNNNLKKNKLLSSTAKSSKSLHINLRRGVNKSCQISERYFADIKHLLERNSAKIPGRSVAGPVSCDNFDNFIVTFDSSSSMNLSASQKGPSLEDSLKNGITYSSKRDSPANNSFPKRLPKIMDTTSWLEMRMEPIKYLVYQNFLQRVVDKSRTCIKSSLGRREDQNSEQLYCACSTSTPKKTPKPRDSQKSSQNETGDKQCKLCGCACCSAKPTISKDSNSLKNVKKGAGVSWNTRILPPLVKCSKSLKRFCKSSSPAKRKSNREVCFCAPKESKMVACVPDMSDVGVQICSDNEKPKSDKVNCQCGQCKKFSEDGSCSCSHCLGDNDKSSQASNNAVGIQCICADGKDEAAATGHNKSNNLSNNEIKEEKFTIPKIKEEPSWSNETSSHQTSFLDESSDQISTSKENHNMTKHDTSAMTTMSDSSVEDEDETLKLT